MQQRQRYFNWHFNLLFKWLLSQSRCLIVSLLQSFILFNTFFPASFDSWRDRRKFRRQRKAMTCSKDSNPSWCCKDFSFDTWGACLTRSIFYTVTDNPFAFSDYTDYTTDTSSHLSSHFKPVQVAALYFWKTKCLTPVTTFSAHALGDADSWHLFFSVYTPEKLISFRISSSTDTPSFNWHFSFTQHLQRHFSLIQCLHLN